MQLSVPAKSAGDFGLEAGVGINLSRLLKITMGDQCLAEACWSLSTFSFLEPLCYVGQRYLCHQGRCQVPSLLPPCLCVLSDLLAGGISDFYLWE